MCYPNEFNALVEQIKLAYAGHFASEKVINQFILNGGWKARKNGRDLSIRTNYREQEEKNQLSITILHPRTDWHQWIKTIGVLQNEATPFMIDFRGEIQTFSLEEEEDAITVRIDIATAKSNPLFVKLLKNVFRKVASCVQCRVCEADCHNGALHMDNGQVIIDDTCLHCSMCHKVEKGCLVYKSLERPKGLSKMGAKNQSLNCYSHHAPRMDWFVQFFKYKENFNNLNSLGTNMQDFFKRFLKDAGLMANNVMGKTANSIDRVGLEDEMSWGLMLSNLVYSPQFNWFVNRINFNETYQKDYVLSILVDDGAKESWVSDIWSSFTRISDLPFSKVGFGFMTKDGKKSVAITRRAWQSPAPLVILYSLYKYAEACGSYYQFSLSRLYDEGVDSDGVSPARIFGIEQEKMKQILNGLSVSLSDYINVAFTFDLDNITLKADKTSEDVLALF